MHDDWHILYTSLWARWFVSGRVGLVPRSALFASVLAPSWLSFELTSPARLVSFSVWFRDFSVVLRHTCAFESLELYLRLVICQILGTWLITTPFVFPWSEYSQCSRTPNVAAYLAAKYIAPLVPKSEVDLSITKPCDFLLVFVRIRYDVSTCEWMSGTSHLACHRTFTQFINSYTRFPPKPFVLLFPRNCSSITPIFFITSQTLPDTGSSRASSVLTLEVKIILGGDATSPHVVGIFLEIELIPCPVCTSEIMLKV